MIRIVLADDHPFVRAGVRSAIGRDMRMQVIGEAGTPSELVDLCSGQKPDIVVTDYTMPGDDTYGDGIKLIEYLRRHFPRIRLIVLTMVTNSLIVASLYDLGVSGVLLKSDEDNELIKALHTAAQGRTYRRHSHELEPSLRPKQDSTDARIASLSPKEIEVLRHFVSGMSVSDIARVLKRGITTVSTQKSSAMRKLGVDSDQALIAYCIEVNAFH